MRNKESFFLTRGYFTAEFLREQGMKFVKPTGCPSLYFAPNEMKRSLSALANPGLAEAQRIAFGGYLGSVADTIVDAHALLKPDSVASYVVQDEVVAYSLSLTGDDNDIVYDRASGRITGRDGIQAFRRNGSGNTNCWSISIRTSGAGRCPRAISASAAASTAASSACRPARLPS